MQHFTYTLKKVRSSDACLKLKSHASAKTSLDVPPRLNPMKAKTVRMETGHISHRHVFGGCSCKLERRQHVFRQRSHLILPVYLHTEHKRHTLTSKQNHSILHLEGMQKFRCMSEIWHHKLQQRSSLDVPPRFKPLKATNCGTGDLQKRHTASFSDAQLHVGAAATHVSPEISLAGASHCTPKINITHA